MRSLVALMLTSLLLVPGVASADVPRVWARLPVARGEEMLSALRLELAGRGEVLVGAPLTDELTVSAVRAEAAGAGATHALWVTFPSGLLAPAEVRLLDVAQSAPAHAMTPQAWDVVDARVVAVLASSLLDGDVPASASASAPEPPPQALAEPPAAPVLVVVTEAPVVAAPVAEAAPASADASLELAEPVLTARPARTFSLALGAGIGHLTRPGESVSTTGGAPMSFYARVSEWASIGVRFSLGGGASSIEGAMITFWLGLPSFAASFRESLGTAAAIEIGAHIEGALLVDWQENRVRGTDTVNFGLGAGVFATLELGAANALQLDYTFTALGFSAASLWTQGIATFSYVHRWD